MLFISKPTYPNAGASPQSFLSRSIPIFIALTAILFTYGIKGKLFYINWISGFSIIAVGSLYYCLKTTVPKQVILSFMLMSSWLAYELFVTPFAINPHIHFKYLCVTLFYITASVLIVNSLTSGEAIYAHTIFWSNFVWVIINFLFFIIYLAGLVEYASTFSGIFHNRNQFAVVSTVLFTLLIFSYSSFYSSSKKLIFFVLITHILLIISSLSLKGFIGLIIVLGVIASSKLNLLRKILVFLLLLTTILVVLRTDNMLEQRLSRVYLTVDNPEELNIGESTFTRAWLITESFKIFLQHPLTGIGLNNSHLLLIPPFKLYLFDLNYIQEVSGAYSHCNYTEMLLNGGILAFLLYYGPIFWLLGKSLTEEKLPKNQKDFILTLCLYKLFLDVAMVSYFDFIHTLIIALMFNVYFRANHAKNFIYHVYA